MRHLHSWISRIVGSSLRHPKRSAVILLIRCRRSVGHERGLDVRDDRDPSHSLRMTTLRLGGLVWAESENTHGHSSSVAGVSVANAGST